MKNKLALKIFLVALITGTSILKANLVDNFQSSKQNSNSELIKPVEHSSTGISEKQNVLNSKSQINIEPEIPNKQDKQKKIEFSGIRPEDMSSVGKSFKLFEISFDKKQLMYYGAEAFAIIAICGVVAYVAYKNGTFKKISDYVVENKFEVRAVVGMACFLAFVGICAKRGITVQSSSNCVANFFGVTRA